SRAQRARMAHALRIVWIPPGKDYPHAGPAVNSRSSTSVADASLADAHRLTRGICYAQSVPKPSKRLQPRSYHAFRCIGADCEDTCCVGWIVNVDKQTYEAYQRSDDPELGPRLHKLVTINTGHSSDDDYARIKL